MHEALVRFCSSLCKEKFEKSGILKPGWNTETSMTKLLREASSPGGSCVKRPATPWCGSEVHE